MASHETLVPMYEQDFETKLLELYREYEEHIDALNDPELYSFGTYKKTFTDFMAWLESKERQ